MPLLGPVIDHYLWPNLPIERSRLRDPSFGGVFYFIATANLILGIVSTIGLCLFKRWARITTIVGTLIGLILYPFASYFISTGLKASTDSLALLLDGAVITLSFWSPLAQRFEPSKGNASPPEH